MPPNIGCAIRCIGVKRAPKAMWLGPNGLPWDSPKGVAIGLAIGLGDARVRRNSYSNYRALACPIASVLYPVAGEILIE